MKLKYDMCDNYKKHYNEAQGMLILKNILKKKDSTKIKTYTTYYNTNFLFLFFVLFLGSVVFSLIKYDFLKKLCNELILIAIAVYLFVMLVYFLSLISNKDNKSGELIIDKDGISDKCNGLLVQISYEHINMIVVTKNTIVIIPDKKTIIIFIPNNEKEKVIKSIKKYSNVTIIDKSI